MESDSYDKINQIWEFRLYCDEIQKLLKKDSLKVHIKQSFDEFVNQPENQGMFAQHLVHYIHQIVKQPNLPDVTQIRDLFRMLYTLDIFEKHYL